MSFQLGRLHPCAVLMIIYDKNITGQCCCCVIFLSNGWTELPESVAVIEPTEMELAKDTTWPFIPDLLRFDDFLFVVEVGSSQLLFEEWFDRRSRWNVFGTGWFSGRSSTCVDEVQIWVQRVLGLMPTIFQDFLQIFRPFLRYRTPRYRLRFHNFKRIYIRIQGFQCKNLPNHNRRTVHISCGSVACTSVFTFTNLGCLLWYVRLSILVISLSKRKEGT